MMHIQDNKLWQELLYSNLVHESHMFSDIEIDRFQNIVKLYSKYEKQIFISVDKVGELDEDVLLKICIALDCDISDIMEIVKE